MTAALRVGLALWLALVVACAWGEVAVPPLQARVTDLTGTLDARQRAELETTLKAFEARKGSQLAVLLVPTTQPETIEQYAMRVAEQWKLGRKGVDDGALLLVAKQDHALRIEVGYGLEGAIPDAVAKRIVSEIIIPHLKQGDFAAGIKAGIDAMIKTVDGEQLPAAPRRSSSPHDSGGGSGNWLYMLLFLIAGASVLRSIFGLFGSLLAGGVAGVLAWLAFGSIFAAIVAAILAVVFSFGRVGGFIPGGFGGGSGGFSGGGGGFGGGGASGRW